LAIRQLLRNSLPALLIRWGTKLRFPYLFLLTACVFVANLLIPDVIPFVDEILIGLVTVGLAKLKKQPTSEQDSAALNSHLKGEPESDRDGTSS